MNKRQLNEAVRVALAMQLISKSNPTPNELHKCPECGHEYWNQGPKYCPECKKRLWKKSGE